MMKLSLTINDAVETSGIPRSTIYELIGKGDLTAKKIGRRTLIEGESLRNFIANCPSAKIKARATA